MSVPAHGSRDGSSNLVRRLRTGSASSVTLKPGQSVTLSFIGVIGLKTDHGQHGQRLVIGSMLGNSYTVGLDGEGFQTCRRRR